MNGVSKAIKLCGLAHLARKLGVTYQAVRKWERGRIPAERCADVVSITNGRVTLHELRADLWAESDRGGARMADAA